MTNTDVLALIDEGGLVVEWGRPAEEMFGVSPEEAVGQPIGPLVQGAVAGGLRSDGPQGSVVVKPVLREASVFWQVLTMGGALPGQDLAILKVLFTQLPVGLCVLDNQLRVQRTLFAPGSRAMSGGRVGSHLTASYAPEDREAQTTAARGVLESGRPVMHRLVRGVDRPGEVGHRVHSVCYFRLEDSCGNVLGLVSTEVDVTEREKAELRRSVLDTVHARVGQQLNVSGVCQELVESVVPAFAGIAVVEVVEDIVNGAEPPPVPVAEGIALRRAAVQGQSSSSSAGTACPLPAGTPFSQVLSDLRPRLIPIGQDSSWLACDPARQDIIGRSGAHSMIVAPLTLHGRALGVISFYRRTHEEPFEDDDLALTSSLCAHAALCVDNASRYMREWMVALTVQRRLIPQRPATRATVEISHLHLPDPQGGGAWLDAIALPGARTALVVGEVVGQGITAAITVGLLRTAVHTLAALDLQPDELLARLSDTAARLFAAYAAKDPVDPLSPELLSACCTVAIYDPVELTCTITRAGLPQPVLVHPDGTSVTLAIATGPLLAGTDSAPFPATTVSLPPGAVLALGTEALQDVVLTPSGLLRPCLDSAATRPLDQVCDDISLGLADSPAPREKLLLLARTQALPAERSLTCALPLDPKAASAARSAASSQLRIWGVDEETSFTAELIISELVGNAVRYGAPPLRLRLILDHMLTCEVSDSSMSAPHVQHARTVDETGRGLFIIASLAQQWGVRYLAREKTVWAELSTTAGSIAAKD